MRLLGLNGFLVLHVLLLFGVCVCGYKFLAARSAPAPSLMFTLAFVGATCVPVYAVFLAPEILHFSIDLLRLLPVAVQGGRSRTRRRGCAGGAATSRR